MTFHVFSYHSGTRLKGKPLFELVFFLAREKELKSWWKHTVAFKIASWLPHSSCPATHTWTKQATGANPASEGGTACTMATAD